MATISEGKNLIFSAILGQNYIMMFNIGHYSLVDQVSILCPDQKVMMYSVGIISSSTGLCGLSRRSGIISGVVRNCRYTTCFLFLLFFLLR